MISLVEIQKPEIAQQIYNLQQAAYTVERQLIGYPTLPPLLESLVSLRQSGEQFLVFQEEGQIVGALSYTCTAKSLEICRVMVSPGHLRRGIAGKLLASVENVGPDVHQIVVSTAVQNHPAIALYEKSGYRQTYTTTLPDGLKLVTLHKRLP